MESMTLRCPVTIKAKVTEDLKKKLTEDIQDKIQKADIELQQIEFHAKRLMAEQAKQDAQGLVPLRHQVENERQKRLEFKNRLLEKLKETAQLELGSEIVQGTLDRVVEVKIGDQLPQLMNAEILLEDGKVLAFRA